MSNNQSSQIDQVDEWDERKRNGLWELYGHVRETLSKNPDCNVMRILAADPEDGKFVNNLAYMGGWIMGYVDKEVKRGALREMAVDIGGDYETIKNLSTKKTKQGTVVICGLSLLSWPCPCEICNEG